MEHSNVHVQKATPSYTLLHLQLFYTPRACSGETEAQRQEIAETRTHCSFVDACFLRRGFPKLSCSWEVSISALSRCLEIILGSMRL